MPRSPKSPPLQWFLTNANSLDIGKQDTFLTAYPYLVRSFAKLKPGRSKEDFVLAAHAVYGWMPTVLDVAVKGGNLPLREVAFLTGKAGSQESEVAAIEILYECIGTLPKERNGQKTERGKSIVAVSKFLHFLAPTRWPIWDKKVGRIWSLGTKLPAGYGWYAQTLRKNANLLGDVNEKVNQKLQANGYAYAVTPLRAAEMVMFYHRPQQ